eukprot:764271-Hanusia_phi.AAC.6
MSSRQAVWRRLGPQTNTPKELETEGGRGKCETKQERFLRLRGFKKIRKGKSCGMSVCHPPPWQCPVLDSEATNQPFHHSVHTCLSVLRVLADSATVFLLVARRDTRCLLSHPSPCRPFSGRIFFPPWPPAAPLPKLWNFSTSTGLLKLFDNPSSPHGLT